MERRLHIEQADANKFFDFLIKSRTPSTLSNDSSDIHTDRYPHAILADAYGLGLSQAEELYLNWLDMRRSQSGTPL
jgi:hypothetical protein